MPVQQSTKKEFHLYSYTIVKAFMNEFRVRLARCVARLVYDHDDSSTAMTLSYFSLAVHCELWPVFSFVFLLLLQKSTTNTMRSQNVGGESQARTSPKTLSITAIF